METKHVSGVIPLDLHQRASEEIRATESTMIKFLEMVIREHYEKGANKVMEKGRTLAFQVSKELFQKVKEYLDLYEKTYHRRLTQKEFVIGLIEQALEEAEEEFEAAEAAEQEECSETADENDEPDGEEYTEETAGESFSENPDEGALQENVLEGWEQDRNEETEPDDADDTVENGESNENEEETYAYA